MGLAVHCTGDFINPGWEATCRSNSQILSLSAPAPPYFSICQLMLVRCRASRTEPTGRGPSQQVRQRRRRSVAVWRDERVRQLQERLGTPMRPRLSDGRSWIRFASRAQSDRAAPTPHRPQARGPNQNADQVLSDFARREKRRRLIDNATLTAPVLFGGAALAGVFVRLDFG